MTNTTNKVIITNVNVRDKSKIYLKSNIQYLVSMLASNPSQVFEQCWTTERSEAMLFDMHEARKVFFAVESVLLIPDTGLAIEYFETVSSDETGEQ